MSTQTCTAALNYAMGEVRTICPEVQNIFLFNLDRQILAKDPNTDEAAIHQVIESVGALNSRVGGNGEVESLAFHGDTRQIMIRKVNNVYLATVAANEASEGTLHAVNCLLVPTVLKVLEFIQPGLTKTAPEAPVSSSYQTEKEKAQEPEPIAPVQEDTTYDLPLPKTPVNQFIVENLGGIGTFFGSKDFAQIDSTVIASWRSLYGDRRIEEIDVEETRTGRHVRCRFKPLKDPKFEGKGHIQLPQKVQVALQTQRGALVMVKPVV